MTRYFVGVPGFLNRLPLLPPDRLEGTEDQYVHELEGDLRAGRPATVRVVLSGRQLDLHLNPAALMWWYLASEEEQEPDEVDARWPVPS